MPPRRGPEQHARARTFKALLLAGACVALLVFKLRQMTVESAADRAPERCKHWTITSRLGGGCVASLPPGTTAFPCCSNGNLGPSCSPCSQPLLRTLECLAPRHMLLQPQPGCAAQPQRQPPLPPPLPPQLPCGLDSRSLTAGSWVLRPPSLPAAPYLSFRPAVPCIQERPLGAAEVPGCLWAAGFDRVVVSGDSTMRQLYTRLIGLIRQQPQVMDAGASLVYAHYTLTACQPTAAGGVPDSSSGSSSSSSGSSSSSINGSPIFTDSLWFSPPGNTLPGQFNLSTIATGLQHLLLRTTAAAAQPAGEAAGQEEQAARTRPGAAAAAAGTFASRRLTLDFIVGPLASWQQSHVRAYLRSPLWSGTAWQRSTLLLLSLCVWEQEAAEPEGWLRFIEEVQQQVGQVVLLTCPTDRFKTPDKAAGRAVVARRNELVRKLVADSWGSGSGSQGDSRGRGDAGMAGSSTGRRSGAAASAPSSTSNSGSNSSNSSASLRPLLLLDLDALTKQGLPPGVAISSDDYHYQCYPSTSSGFANGSLAWAGGDGSARPYYPPRRFELLQVPASGSCADPVNYAAWQLLLGALCNAT